MKILSKPKKDVKEYIKYENGDFVSIEVEQEPKPQKHNPYEPENIVPQVPLTKKIKERSRAYFTKKRLQKIGLIIVAILFVFALYDTYKVFFVTPDQTTQTQTKPGSGISTPITNGTSGQQTQVVPTQPVTSNPVQTTPPATTTETPTTPSQPTTTPSTPPTTGQSDTTSIVKNLLTIANQVNTVMVSATNDEVSYIQAYESKQANKIGLQSSLTKSQKQKENLFTTLNSYKSMYQKQGMEKLYQITENRLLDSLLFSKQALAWTDSGSGTFETAISDFIKKDDETRRSQQTELISVLNANGIPYTINDQQTEVNYTIQ